MDLMMYMPNIDDDFQIIQQRLARLAYTGGHGQQAAIEASNELLGMGKFIAGHVLNAWEKPPTGGLSWDERRYYNNLYSLLVTMIERGDLTLEQLQRYRRLITSEKL
jgi:hypothetical protein